MGKSGDEKSDLEMDELVESNSKKRGRPKKVSLKGKPQSDINKNISYRKISGRNSSKRGSPSIGGEFETDSRDEEKKISELSSDEDGDESVVEPKEKGRLSKAGAEPITPPPKVVKKNYKSPRVVDKPQLKTLKRGKTTDDGDDDSETNNKSSGEEEDDSKVEEPRKTGQSKKTRMEPKTPPQSSSQPVDKPKPKSKTPKKDNTKTVNSDDEDSETDGIYYEVNKIKDVHFRKDGTREFLVSWKGYKTSDDTWEPEAHLDCADLIKKFMEKVQRAKEISPKELRKMSRKQQVVPVPHARIHCGYRLRNPGFRPFYEEE